MVVVILILLSLGVAGFIMVSDARKNDSFKRLEQTSRCISSTVGMDGRH